jgi:hypothetical protein
LVMVASLVAITSVLWAGIYKAAQVVGDLTTRVPVTIAASAVSISASSLTPLPYLLRPYTSGRSEPPTHLCPLPLVRMEFS